MIQLTITLEDDGRIIVESPEMEQPYECDSKEECLQFVDRMMAEEMGDGSEEQATEGPENYEEMWNEEAQRRQPQPGLMA